MNSIKINGRTLEYEVFYDVSEYGETYETAFYEGTKTERRKKYLLFGPTIEKTVPNEIFKLYLNIEDPGYTKDDIRRKIERALELLERPSEIERGEIV